MAKVTRVELVDDLDGTTIPDGGGESIDFSLDGKSYSIDLSADNAKKLREAFEPWTAKATRVGGATRSAGRRGARSAGGAGYGPEQLAEIREWARSNGMQVADRGRVKQDIIDAYEAR